MVLTEGELKSLSETISKAERRTSGELRLIIAKRSSQSSHVFPLLSLMLACASLVYLWSSRHQLLMGDTTWILPMVLAGAVGIGFVFSKIPVVQRQLTWGPDLEHQALMRAELEFHREGLGGTHAKTGILLFLSLHERQAVVLADKGISSKLDQKTWDEVVALIVKGAKEKNLKEHLEQAIVKCGDLLAKEFPLQAGDRNELPNHVLVKE